MNPDFDRMPADQLPTSVQSGSWAALSSALSELLRQAGLFCLGLSAFFFIARGEVFRGLILMSFTHALASLDVIAKALSMPSARRSSVVNKPVSAIRTS